ncbi:hypothetical protein K474DRAFT_1680102 [Panus rudis PR-1116 ss-1]|nr:hypothetical protein K474DRAFT_1680102 [Panus rudis PR-1116 ss-1]
MSLFTQPHPPSPTQRTESPSQGRPIQIYNYGTIVLKTCPDGSLGPVHITGPADGQRKRRKASVDDSSDPHKAPSKSDHSEVEQGEAEDAHGRKRLRLCDVCEYLLSEVASIRQESYDRNVHPKHIIYGDREPSHDNDNSIPESQDPRGLELKSPIAARNSECHSHTASKSAGGGKDNDEVVSDSATEEEDLPPGAYHIYCIIITFHL